MKIQIKILDKKFYNEESNGILLNPLPKYQTSGAAALDLVSTEDVIVYPGQTKLISTGIAVWIGSGNYVKDDVKNHLSIRYAGLIIPRSSLGARGLVLANTIGLIDEDYQGEIKLAIWNRQPAMRPCHDNEFSEIFHITAGDRLAQLMIVPILRGEWELVDEFSHHTNRNIGGFGSTGK